MAILSDELSPPLVLGTYQISNGMFRTNPSWHTCREQFHETWCVRNEAAKEVDFYYVYHPGVQTLEDIHKALDEADKMLGLPEKDQATLKRVDPKVGGKAGDLVCYISPSEWWLDPVRYMLFTAIIRDARKGGLEGSMKDAGCRYLKNTKEAVYKFLGGNTFYNEEYFPGWLATFSHVYNKEKPLVLAWADQKGSHSKTITDPLSLLQNTPSAVEKVMTCYHRGWGVHVQPLLKR
jgi:hypothetical protein